MVFGDEIHVGRSLGRTRALVPVSELGGRMTHAKAEPAGREVSAADVVLLYGFAEPSDEARGLWLPIRNQAAVRGGECDGASL
jgi:hypothetical protein